MKPDSPTNTVRNVVDDIDADVSDVEDRVKSTAKQASYQAEELAMDAQIKATETLNSIEQYIREKPVQAAGIAFAAGIVATFLLRKR